MKVVPDKPLGYKYLIENFGYIIAMGLAMSVSNKYDWTVGLFAGLVMGCIFILPIFLITNLVYYWSRPKKR